VVTDCIAGCLSINVSTQFIHLRINQHIGRPVTTTLSSLNIIVEFCKHDRYNDENHCGHFVVVSGLQLSCQWFCFATGQGRYIRRKSSVPKKHGFLPEDDIAALRAAAAKAREEADMLSNALGKKSTGPTKVNAKTSLSINDAITMTTRIDFEGGDAVSQTMLLDELTSNGDFALWKSAAKDQSLRTFPVSLQFLREPHRWESSTENHSV
jgi:hypothetical protein